MRHMLHSTFAYVLSAIVFAAAFVAFHVHNLFVRVVGFAREALDWPAGFARRLADRQPLARCIMLLATALNGRDLGGVRCRGDLGGPACRMLTG